MNKLHYYIIYFFSVLVLLSACKSKTIEETAPENENIEITKAQFESERMELGSPQYFLFKKKVHSTGYIVPKANGKARVSTPIGGIINKINVTDGQYVQKSTPLMEIGGNQVIDLQRDFAGSCARLDQLTIEFNRAKELFESNIKTEKEFVLAQSAYKSELAIYSSLKLKLKNVNVDVELVKKGVFSEGFIIKAPISGYLNNLNVYLGQYIEPQDNVAEIIDDKKLHLKLSVFEHDFDKVKKGQKVEFSFTGDSDFHEAIISNVGKVLNEDTKAIDCFAEVGSGFSGPQINNRFITGNIIVDTDSLLAIPRTAFVNSGEAPYILSLVEEKEDRYVFEKLNIKTGRTSKDMVEVMQETGEMTILMDGVYNVQ